MTAATQEQIRVGEIDIRFLLQGIDSGGSLALIEVDVPAGEGVPAAHSHMGYEETIYGLRGVVEWTVDGVSTKMGRGDLVRIPRGAVHSFVNEGNADATMLAIVTPGVVGPDYFREVADVLNATTDQSPDIAAIQAIMRRHGLSPA